MSFDIQNHILRSAALHAQGTQAPGPSPPRAVATHESQGGGGDVFEATPQRGQSQETTPPGRGRGRGKGRERGRGRGRDSGRLLFAECGNCCLMIFDIH